MRNDPAAFAALFPGQLSERAGMGEALAKRFPEVASSFEQISRRAGIDLSATFFGEGSPNLHENLPSQVGVFAVSLAVLDVLEREFGTRPEAVAGYSLGTYAAFVAAGALDRWQALDVLLEAERLLAIDPVSGGMGFVIGLPRPALEEILREVSEDSSELSIGTENAAQQLVITGSPEAVKAAIALALPRSLRAELLPLTSPMHSSRLRGVSERLARFVAGVRVVEPTRAALYAPMLGRRIQNADEAARVLAGQISELSRWSTVLRLIGESGLTRFAELGPGDVLTRLLRWTVRGARGTALSDPASITEFVSKGLPENASPLQEERV